MLRTLLRRFRRPREAGGGIQAAVTPRADGTVTIDVRGQTCPGYLLAINRAMDSLEAGTAATLLVDYPPCGEDIQAWCSARGYRFEGVEGDASGWSLRVTK
ncbi:MAG: sulfurtransferase TusA family protein [Pseudomonadota bacterium]